MDFPRMHQQLLDPATYPEPTCRVEFRETHISRVYLTETHAYKLKKPLDLGFLDYSTLARRGFFCAEEVRLNRRFAPDAYLGVAELRDDRGRLRFDGPGELVEFAVRMRRLPEDRMLDRLLAEASGELPREIDRLARHLPSLFAAAGGCSDAAGDGNAALVRANCEENLAQTAALVGPALSAAAQQAMARQTREQLDRLAPLLARREAQGYVRDGHGDLHTRNICMTDPVQVYDCIEFNRRYRVADIAADLAFLLMDLEYRGRRDLARQLLATYLAQTVDPDLDRLLPFYKSYRAWVRGKVEALLAGETDVAAATRAEALASSRRYFNLALGYQAPRSLLLTTGLMGAGKTTLAQALAATLGAAVLRSDVIRKELAGLAPGTRREDAFGAGLYAPAMSDRTYAEMRHRAAGLLGAGETVVVDAAFIRNAERRLFLALAGDMGIPVRLLHLQCDRDASLTRLTRRQAAARDASDGRGELLQSQAEAFETIPPAFPTVTIDSTAAVDYNVQMVLCELLTG